MKKLIEKLKNMFKSNKEEVTETYKEEKKKAKDKVKAVGKKVKGLKAKKKKK